MEPHLAPTEVMTLGALRMRYQGLGATTGGGWVTPVILGVVALSFLGMVAIGESEYAKARRR